MRRVAAAAALCCGCNQFYGLDPTTTRDAGVSDRAFRLSMLIGETTGSDEAAPAFVPLPSTDLKIALLDEPLVAATFVADATGALVDYPFAFVGKPWRFEYTPPFDVPHELQWNPPVGAGHVVAPLVGRLARTAPPIDTGFTLSMKKPDNSLYSFSPNTVIYTSGYWSATPSAFQTLTPAVDFSKAVPMHGARGVPATAAGDKVVAIDYTAGSATSCTRAIVSGGTTAPELESGVMKPVELAIYLQGDEPSLQFDGPGMLDAQTRLMTALGARTSDQTGSRIVFGRIASTAMPSFTATRDGVPAPLVIPVFDCPVAMTPGTTTNDAGGSLSFAKAFYAFVSDDRIVDGARLRSSIAVVGLPKADTYEANSQVPLATSIMLGSSALDVDGATIAASPADLSFALNATLPFVADYYEVTLYRIANAMLEPIRVYVGNDVAAARPTLRFDPSIMTAGATYVFAIRVYRGRPNARVGDFSTIQNPQAVSTIFTSTFKR